MEERHNKILCTGFGVYIVIAKLICIILTRRLAILRG